MPNMTDPKIFLNITKPMRYRASYVKKDYTVVWKNWDGNVLKSESVPALGPANPPANPTKPGYQFTGWDKLYNKITDDMEITAVYGGAIDYVVTWKNWDGTVLKTETVPGATAATPPTTTPTKPNCTFIKWDTAYDCITGDKVITAVFSALKCTVKWNDWNGTTIKTETVDENSTATPPSDPSRTGYTFAGWGTTDYTITADKTFTAQYTPISYTVRFENWDGTLLGSSVVYYGGSATEPSVPNRPNYTFTGWSSKAYQYVTEDVTITAQYEVEKIWTVTWKSWDGTVLRTESISNGKPANAPSAPTRPGYQFTGWDKAYSSITSNTTITALYKADTISYRYVFANDDTNAETYSPISGNAVISAIFKDSYKFSNGIETQIQICKNGSPISIPSSEYSSDWELTYSTNLAVAIHGSTYGKYDGFWICGREVGTGWVQLKNKVNGIAYKVNITIEAPVYSIQEVNAVYPSGSFPNQAAANSISTGSTYKQVWALCLKRVNNRSTFAVSKVNSNYILAGKMGGSPTFTWSSSSSVTYYDGYPGIISVNGSPSGTSFTGTITWSMYGITGSQTVSGKIV